MAQSDVMRVAKSEYFDPRCCTALSLFRSVWTTVIATTSDDSRHFLEYTTISSHHSPIERSDPAFRLFAFRHHKRPRGFSVTKTQKTNVLNGGRLRHRRRFGCLLLLAALLSIAGIYGVIWWQERPLSMAAELNEQGEPSKAMEIIDEFLREHPQHGRALSLRARVLVSLNQPARAIDLFERVGAPEAEDMHAWAKALLQLERWSEALPVLEFVGTTGVHRADVLHELAACRMKLGDVEGAIEAATEFSEQPNCEARGMLLLGTIYWEQGEFQRVVTVWEELLKHQPDADSLQIPANAFFLEYGRALLEIGQPELAEVQLRRAVELQETPEGLIELANALSATNHADEADGLYRRALELDPSNSRARTGAAQLSLMLGAPDQALEWLAPLETKEDISSEVAFLLQQTYTRLDQLDAAEMWRQRADQLRKREAVQSAANQVLRDSPNSDWADVIRAYRFAETGNWNEAKSLLLPMQSSAEEQPFIKALIEAVNNRSDLPPLEDLPFTLF